MAFKKFVVPQQGSSQPSEPNSGISRKSIPPVSGENAELPTKYSPASIKKEEELKLSCLRCARVCVPRDTPHAIPAIPAIRQLPSITGFEERAACLEFEGGMSRAEANHAAAKEFGFKNPRELFTAVINSWRKNIEAAFLPAPASDAEQKIFGAYDALKNSSLEFLDGEFVRQAVSCGWDPPQPRSSLARRNFSECAAVAV
jgi:hypothetical protein